MLPQAKCKMNFVAGLAGGLQGSGFNPGNVLDRGLPFLSQYMNQNFQQNLQDNYFKGEQGLQNNFFDRTEGAFTKYGLPSYMAYQGGQNTPQLPRDVWQLNGSNYYTGGYSGTKQPMVSNQWQTNAGYGTPNIIPGSQNSKPTYWPNNSPQKTTGDNFVTPRNALGFPGSNTPNYGNTIGSRYSGLTGGVNVPRSDFFAPDQFQFQNSGTNYRQNIDGLLSHNVHNENMFGDGPYRPGSQFGTPNLWST